ncbi:MAG: hypothetical protein UR68_C0006G0008 [Candidatus Roizmanbacteria bacterium GW2011_GWA2_35_19]|uniref:Uncharacterized protein n=2 Tax=Candidatus Roizmaniibacteriota TaxID=1752723 RepID=A0A0G0CAQ7_9BACT|nr:MAG: hypothetical protein UR63_C0015G0007 [Candidatus Roizmanbacteria bacterium GW2011_GWC2_35_12]KKP73191.1 MAG: hypothetical protein UR68_C0006G0008 [Candidatus Roizmanbacteria bacterium GW2011_GWA2_35_19]
MKNKQINLKTQVSKLKSVFLLFVYLFICLFVYSQGVVAQSIMPLIVAPARQELEVDPGGKSAINVRFYNSGEMPVSGILRIADFVVQDTDGTPVIIDNPALSSPKFSGASWFTIPYDRITIPATDKVTIQATISVPETARPGGRYVAVYFEPGPEVPKAVGGINEAGTGVGSRIAALVYLKVAGVTAEKAIVSRFFTPSFFEYGPITLETEILNRGDYHIRPRGVVSLTNMTGGLVDQKRLPEENIFPDTSRSFKNELGTKWMMGRYRLDLAASYGLTGQALEKSTYVWVFPWRVATAVILAIIIVSMLINKFYKNFTVKENELEKALEKEKEEIEKLKSQLRKRGI